MRERVLITGIGCVSSFGLGHSALVTDICSGYCGIVPITAFDTSTCHSHRGAMIRDFDPTAFIPPMKLRRTDAVSRVALACVRMLFDDARVAPGPVAGEATGIAVGTFSAGLDSVVEYMSGLIEHGPTGVPAILFSNTVSNAPASLCAIEFGLRGPNVTFNQREASSLSAIIFSVGAIRDGRIAAMVSGGADCLEETFFKVHDRFRALSPIRNHRQEPGAPDEAARPFDRRHNGFILGEGGFLLLLESGAAAARRDARVYGEILGVSVTASKAALNGWPESSSGLARSMRLALADARLEPEAIAAVFATANGSPGLDELEAEAINDVFGGRGVAVASVKGAIGESGAAGAGSLVAGLLSIGEGRIVPTTGFAQPDPACGVGVSSCPQPAGSESFIVNSVASGGTNCSIVVRATNGQR
jgi:3-oxoacyl-[acyl-carrier-protein] synthase II